MHDVHVTRFNSTAGAAGLLALGLAVAVSNRRGRRVVA
jgi:hypothetical protein